MLQDLKVLNGKMSLEFDSLNTVYTIILDSDDDFVDLSYKIGQNDQVSIFGNDLVEGVNEVVLTVYNDKEQTSYYLYVLKETKTVAGVVNDGVGLDLKINGELYNYAVPIISVACFLFLLLFFTFLFKKN